MRRIKVRTPEGANITGTPAEQPDIPQVLTFSPTNQRPTDKSSYHSLDGSGDVSESHQISPRSRGRTRYRIRDEERPPRPSNQRHLEIERSQQPEPSSIHIPRILPIRRLGPPPRRPLINPPYRRLREQSPEPTTPPYGSLQPVIVSNAVVAEYGRIGAQYQSWISGRNRTACPIQRSTLAWSDLVDPPSAQDKFEVCADEIRFSPEEAGNIRSVGLPVGRDWRSTFILHRGYLGDGYELGSNVYMHRTGLGAIFAENIARSFGPYWGQIAQAQYQLDHHIDTLRHVYFINVQNPHTSPYVETRLYPRYGLDWRDDNGVQEWAYATRDYQELLGTKLGRAVARLVLGAWPTGTHRIEKIVTWTILGVLQMRFDIKPI
ncbi:hypothetical protein N7457_009644 [Penicillium paradoxum]|uniref:uncharacterized protein n=1 Tax=Penicillium paradoxum TaxID=176176 RepID=UPI002547DE38|nr:uncharacterized protein N7457_009644 [Penicillium paradoxum]KAJ5774748.1 hypothetical protein N7457_009644 [Penicillium paradoxum]